MKITFVRHAESEANAGLRTSDPSLINITKKGAEESKRFADSIHDEPDLVIVSPYIRTWQTAAPLLTRYPSVAVETWPMYEFTFLSPQLCENTTAQDRLPLVKEYWNRCDPDFVHGLGAESFNHFTQRINGSLQKILQLEIDSIMVFTHGQVMKLLKLRIDEGRLPSMDYFKGKMEEMHFGHTSTLTFNPVGID